MISAAAEAKADYVKIQSMRSKDLVYRERFEKGIIEVRTGPKLLKDLF